MLYKTKSYHNGLDERLFDKLISGKIWLKGQKEKKINIQAVVELQSGNYEFISFIPYLPKILP